MLTTDELAQAVADGSIDTVIVAFTDMQGRLMGKRLHGEFFVEEHVGEHGVEGCNYLLALDMEMDPIPGYADRRAGSRATATSSSSPTSPRCGGSRGSRRRRSSSATSCGTTASRSRPRRDRS